PIGQTSKVPTSSDGTAEIRKPRRASKTQIGNWQLEINNVWTCSSTESERDRAKVEVARSNRARSTKSLPISDCRFAIERSLFTRQGPIGNRKSKIGNVLPA